MNIDFKRTRKGLVVLAAGGTGGHLFPAQALAEELVRRDILCCLMSDERVGEYGAKFPAAETYAIPSATVTPRQPLKVPGQMLRLMRGYMKARKILTNIGPDAVVGFGGYPSFPPLLAASRLGIASAIHEQNAVMGRANRAIAGRVGVIASSFPKIANLSGAVADKVVMTGNPVRQMVRDAAKRPYRSAAADEDFNLLVFGGSQGAAFFSQFMPKFLAELPMAIRSKLNLVQQCREEDIANVKSAYENMGIAHEIAPFFSDMPERIAKSHLVICRAGASSVAELGVLGRPSILVPLPNALDNDQLRNAESFKAAGAAWLWRQQDMTPERFVAFFMRLRFEGAELSQAAAAAKAQGRPDAAARLADIVETMMQSGK